MFVLQFSLLERVSILLEDFGSRDAFASNKADAAFDQTFRAHRTIVGSGWSLKLRQLEAIGSIARSAQSRPQGLRQRISLFPPVLFIVWSNLSPGRAFLQGPDRASVSAL
jgi:hypothetical protein